MLAERGELPPLGRQIAPQGLRQALEEVKSRTCECSWDCGSINYCELSLKSEARIGSQA